VAEGGLQLVVVEVLGAQPALVLAGPAGTGTIDPAVPQQEGLQPSAGAAAVIDQVGPGPAQVPDRFFMGFWERMATSSPARCRRARRRQSRRSVLTLSPAARGMSEGAITWQATPWACSSRASS